MPAAVDIRPIAKSDHAVWKDLWTAYLTFYESTRPEAVYAKTWERLLSEGEYEPRGFIAWQGGKAIGLTHYYFHRSCWTIENVCYLQDLFVSPSVRGTGAGKALIEAVYAAAKTENSPSVYWNTQDFNETARKLYDRIATKTDFIKYQRNL